MRKLKKAVAVLLTAAMTMSASVLAFGETVTFHFQNASGWENVGGHIYEGVGFTTNVVPTDKAFVVSKNDDGTDKVVWPGYKCEPDKEGWVKATVTFADAANNGIAIIFNNGVGDTKPNDVGFSQVDADAVIASGIPNDTNATKEQTGNITLGKKAIAKAGGVASDYYITYDGKTYSINDRLNISYQSLFARDVVDNGDYVIATVTFKNATINNTKVDSGSISYFYSKETDKYLLEKINIETSKSISDFTSKTKTSEKPDEINASSKFASTNPEYNYDKLNNLKESDISKIYEANKENIVMLNTISNQATVNRATGFFISDGVIATSWSYLENSFMIGDTIIVSDVLNNTYKCVGLVAMDTENDIAVIKLDKKSGTHVKFGDKTNLSINDPVITITSKTGVGLSSLVGIVSSVNDNLINVLPLEKNDWGSAVFNTDGYVVGINNSKLLNSELSNASSIDTLKTLSTKLKNTKLKDIKATSLEEVKSKYYYKEKNKEEIKKLVDTKIWNKYKSIGNIENTIALNLVKASYYNDTLSLRYENNTSKYIDTLSYVEDFTTTLTNQGYTLKYKSGENTRLMYTKGRDKVVITEEFDYLIILLVRGRVL